MLTKLTRLKSLSPFSFHNRFVPKSFSSGVAEELDDEEPLPSEWYRIAYGKLIKLTRVLKNIEQVNRRTTSTIDGSTITDDYIIGQMRSFNSLAKSFIGSPSMQSIHGDFFVKGSERSSLTLNSLTKACNFLSVSAQQRKNVRLTICPQVTQHHIWRGALEEVLRDLKREIDTLCSRSASFQMGKQIILSCMKFFCDVNTISSSDSPSWMKPPPLNRVEKPVAPRTWEEVVEMFVDLTKCLEREEKLATHVLKLEAMKEGLYQIRDITIERDVSYREVRRQDCLVQRKLSKSLGHSSRCLFTLLLYYLYGSVEDVVIEVHGGVRVDDDGRFCLYIGKILSCSDEGMVMNGVKQLSKALGVFKFVWESAGMVGVLKLRGHLWCVGGEERIIAYRGNEFYVHGIRL